VRRGSAATASAVAAGRRRASALRRTGAHSDAARPMPRGAGIASAWDAGGGRARDAGRGGASVEPAPPPASAVTAMPSEAPAASPAAVARRGATRCSAVPGWSACAADTMNPVSLTIRLISGRLRGSSNADVAGRMP
jgi:hypothetical protein